jgi:hypothetical protein
MRQKRIPVHSIIKWVIIGILSLAIGGCAGTGLKRKESQPKPATLKKVNKNNPLYYDFGDVLIPGEMKADDKGTYIVEAAGFRTGILTLKGRVDRNSLIAFFQSNMVKDNWETISTFKSPVRSMMLFQKDNRWCVITITAKEIYTYAEISVTPTSSDNAM